MRCAISRLRYRLPILGLVMVAAAMAMFAGRGANPPAEAGHFPAGTPLWGNETINGGLGEILEYDIGTDSFVASCTPLPTDDGRGIAHDPADGTLWYTFVNTPDTGYAGDGLIHKSSPPPACAPLPPIPFGDGPGLVIQDAIGALDIDPDDANIWAAGYHPIAGQSFLYKVDRVTGAILQSCSVPFGGGGVGNDTLTVAKLSGLGGSGKYLLTDAGEVTTAPNVLLALDAATRLGGLAVPSVTTFPKTVGMTGTDFEGGKLIATDGPNNIYDLGGPPFAAVLASMPVSPAFFLEDITLEAGPGAPARLTLTPKTATNPVDSQHCVTATVTDVFGNPVPNITVRFSVTGSVNTSGSATTDANGEAQFCYTGPPLPGADAIHAFADTDNDNMQDPGEPFDDATKAWVLPVSTPLCEVIITNGGWIIADNGDRASFGGNAHADGEGNASGEEQYQDHGPAEPFNLHGDVLVVVCNSDTSATIFGEATIDGSGTHIFRIDVQDLGEPGKGVDTYRMRVNAYDSGEQVLRGGNVQIHNP